MPLMERIKCTSFLDMSLADQSALIRSIQLTRSKSLKEASKKKVRKSTKAKVSKAKTKSAKPRKTKVSKALDNLDQASLLELAAKHGIKL